MMETRAWMQQPQWRDDPIWLDQLRVLQELFDNHLSSEVVEGFRIVAGRFVDERGGHRTETLRDIYKTNRPAGVLALRQSLEAVRAALGSFEEFELNYPVTINPSVPAFPMLPIVGIENLADCVYRVIDTDSCVRGGDGRPTGETVLAYVLRCGHLPPAGSSPGFVERSKPKGVHWCSYSAFSSPSATQEALQIWRSWNDCRVRFTLPTAALRGLAFVPFNGDYPNPAEDIRVFDGYYFEPAAQDHPIDESADGSALIGGSVQIAVFGGPTVRTVEIWNPKSDAWEHCSEHRL